MTINWQFTIISSLNSEKNKWLSKKRKKFMFETNSMSGASSRLFKPCHQAPLKAKQMYALSLNCFLLTS